MTVNDQIVDSVTQNTTLLVGNAAPEGMGIVDIVSAKTIGMFMHNAVSSQQQAQISSNASVTAVCVKMLKVVPELSTASTPTLTTEKKAIPPFMPLTNAGAPPPPPPPSFLLDQAQALVDSAITSRSTQEKVDKESDKQYEAALNLLNKKLKTATTATGTTKNTGTGSSGTGTGTTKAGKADKTSKASTAPQS